MSGKQDLGSAAYEKVWESQWGPGYDPEIMKAIWGLQKEEEWDQEERAQGGNGFEGEVIAINSDSSLRQAREHKNRLLADLEAGVGTRKASAIFEKHYQRLEKFLADGKQENPEIAMAAYLADWLGLAAGVVPSHPELDALLTSIRDFGKADADGKADPKSELFHPMIYAAKIRAERENPSDKSTLSKTYLRQLCDCGKSIERRQLFRKTVVRTNKLRGKVLSGLRTGMDRSSILYGLIDPKFKPCA